MTTPDSKIWLSDADLDQRGLFTRITRWRKVRSGEFPKPAILSSGTKRWHKDAILAWESNFLEQEKNGGAK